MEKRNYFAIQEKQSCICSKGKFLCRTGINRLKKAKSVCFIHTAKGSSGRKGPIFLLQNVSA